MEDIKPFSQLGGYIYGGDKYYDRVYDVIIYLSRDEKIRKLIIFKKGYYFRKVKSDSAKGVYIKNHKIYYKDGDKIIYPETLKDFLDELCEIHQAYLRHKKLNKLIKD